MLIGIIINSNIRFCYPNLSNKLLGDAPPEPQTYISNAVFRTVKFDLTNHNYVFRTHTEAQHRLAQSQVPQFRTPHDAQHVIGSDTMAPFAANT